MRVALYCRVSTQEQAQHGLSIDAQTAALDEWAKDKTIVDHYTDLGVSARSPASKRPELQRMLRDCEAGKIDLIAFTKLDRFFRNVKEYYKVEDILEKTHVAWRAIHEDYETETAAGRLKVNIMLAVAQDEADRTSERIKAVFDRKRERGLRPAGAVAFGLALEDGRLVPGKDAQVVRDIFAHYIATRSTNATAMAFRKPPSTLKYLFTNESYLQTGVVDQETWEAVQRIHKEREQRSVRTDRVYLFSGLLYCPICGHRMTCTTATGIVYYRCPQKYTGKCGGLYVRETKLEEYLLSHLMPAVEDVNLHIREKQKKTVDASALKKKRDKLTDLYMEDMIDRNKYETDFRALTVQIEEAERQPKQINEEQVMTVLQAYQTLSPKGKKAFWSNLLTSVTPTEDGYNFTLTST